MRSWLVVAVLAALAVALPCAAPAQARPVGAREELRNRLWPVHLAPPDTAAARALAGCLSLAPEPGTRDSAYWAAAVPRRIELTAERRPGWPLGFWFAVRGPGPERSAEPPTQGPTWSPVGGDSAQIHLESNGFAAVLLFLRRLPDGSFRGVARRFGDLLAEDSTGRRILDAYAHAPIRARPVPCAVAPGTEGPAGPPRR